MPEYHRPDTTELQAATAEMKRLVDSLLDGLDQQREDLPGVVERLSRSRSSAWSADRLAEVVVDAYGIVVEVRLASNAYQAATPGRLARSITEAARSAAALAQQQRADIVSPITETADALPDLPDLFPGAPSLRGIRDIVAAAAGTSEAVTAPDDESETE
ncbi:YbaB/EbfC family nucleoid-associated protein [Nocardia sp. alder85J]|uniref:YbaB/EbfC family nucleoid-associated protein n=1 Tax=Nocardia sp. alder85J TaxID=2862949 RepID=UPI001CD70D52|nr:YbaB/EbfC family nucleoid-associated protein [Nocardia sp. alder85J]MCX4095147.1 YbaB/EbfC family nucleoid-associated protein [Nocardia sp. alder85J]